MSGGTKRVLFLVTELQQPVGGLYRFTTEFLQAWRKLLNAGKTTLAPLVFSLRDNSLSLGDLKPSSAFKEFMEEKEKTGKRIQVYEAIRGGERIFFLESSLTESERNEFHKQLWEKWRVKSEKASSWEYYNKLNAFWKNVPEVTQWIASREGEEIYVIDAQDWLAFPAGFLCKEKIGAPLLCRFHSGEIGRSLGKPDYDNPALAIEVAALTEADFVQSVSVTEMKFELYNLLPLKKELERQLKSFKSSSWWAQQKWRDEYYEEFLLHEAIDSQLIWRNAAGVMNGIILDEWLKVKKSDIERGKQMLKQLLPDKEKHVLFIGRTEIRKGIHALIQALALLEEPTVGLVLCSSFSEESCRNYFKMIKELGLESQVAIKSGWVEEKDKKALFCAADVIALPSLYEPFGIVTLEALAANLACRNNGVTGPIVIVGDTGGMGEVIKSGINGFKIPMGEELFELKPDLLARILKITLKMDYSLKKKISENAAKSVKSNCFNWEYIAQSVLRLYEKARENYYLLKKIKPLEEVNTMPSVEEFFGINAGKVWLALKDSKPLLVSELVKKTRLTEQEVYSALGWLGRENKVSISGDARLGYKFALR